MIKVWIDADESGLIYRLWRAKAPFGAIEKLPRYAIQNLPTRLVRG